MIELEEQWEIVRKGLPEGLTNAQVQQQHFTFLMKVFKEIVASMGVEGSVEAIEELEGEVVRLEGEGNWEVYV